MADRRVRVRTYLALAFLLVALTAGIWVTFLNRELLGARLLLNSETSIPVYAALLAVLLVGMLPFGLFFFIQSLQRDLNRRRERQKSRAAETMEQRLRRAIDLQSDGQWRKAAAELEKLLSERPEDFSALLRYGEVLRRQGRKQEALETHRRASVLYPHSVSLLYQLAEDYEALGESDVAREIGNRILRDYPRQALKVLRRRRDEALANRDWEDAVQWQEKVEALLQDAGETERRERETLISRGLNYQRGVSLLEKDRAADAVAIFRRLTQEEPRFLPAWILLGEAELIENNSEVALEEWRRGFRSTGSPVFLQRIEDHFIEADEPARGIETLRSMIARSEKDLLPRFFLGRLYHRLEMHDEALKVLDGLAERLDAAPSFHFLLGRIRQRHGESSEAIASYLTSLQRLGMPQAGYGCRSCGERFNEWQDRCGSCGAWNTVDLDLQIDLLKDEDLGVVQRPVWGGYETVGSEVAEPSASE